MNRLGTVLWLGFAAVAGIGLFQVKYEVQALEEQLTRLHRQILQDREAIHVLHAEWSYLNKPSRLAGLARRHLDMAPVAAKQLSSFDALPDPLPVPPVAPRFTALGKGRDAAGGAQEAPVIPSTVFVSTRSAR